MGMGVARVGKKLGGGVKVVGKGPATRTMPSVLRRMNERSSLDILNDPTGINLMRRSGR